MENDGFEFYYFLRFFDCWGLLVLWCNFDGNRMLKSWKSLIFIGIGFWYSWLNFFFDNVLVDSLKLLCKMSWERWSFDVVFVKLEFDLL